MPLSKTQKAHSMAGMVYLLYVLGILFGITAVMGVIINHTKLSQTRGTYAYSHFIWQILSFWILFAGALTSFVLWPATTSIMVVQGAFLWLVCSAVFGIWFLSKRKPIPFIQQN